MPVFSPDGDLIGVTQLVNKKKPGEFPEYNPADGIEAPDYFRVSFDDNDEKYMLIFNNQAGVILQNAELLEAVKRQELSLRENLSST
jgi:GAF domain-containing protein